MLINLNFVILLISLFLLLSTNYALSDDVIKPEDIIIREGIYYQKFKLKPFTGKAAFFFSNGQPETVNEFQDGYLVSQTFYEESGIKTSFILYSKGKDLLNVADFDKYIKRRYLYYYHENGKLKCRALAWAPNKEYELFESYYFDGNLHITGLVSFTGYGCNPKNAKGFVNYFNHDGSLFIRHTFLNDEIVKYENFIDGKFVEQK